MAGIKYKVIKSKRQYSDYCDQLERLITKKTKSQNVKDEIELLTVLVKKWDKDQNTFEEVDPVGLLKSLLTERKMTAQDLVKVLGVSKGLVSDILNYKKGLSKETVRKLAGYFKVDQAAFNREYSIKKVQRNKSLGRLAKQAQELDLSYETKEQIKPVVYHNFEEKKRIEEELFRKMPKGKRELLAKELMSIFHSKNRKNESATSSGKRPKKKIHKKD